MISKTCFLRVCDQRCVQGYDKYECMLVWEVRFYDCCRLGGRSRKYLSGLAPVAHNMIRWFSEHDFEQQLMVSRTKRILLQTLYFAYLAKIEAVITELLARLNYTCGHDQELKLNTGIGGCIAAADVLLQSWNEEVGQRHC
uniref:Uncharacterized protein n=1 Tax=Physcomitrium patens TaxID=3218 RepID=A0A7I3Z0U3_PHYPA